MIWNALRIFDPFGFRVEHVVQLFIYLLQPVLQFILMLLTVFQVSEVRVRVILVLLVLLEQLKPVYISLAYLVGLNILFRVHTEEILNIQLLRGLIQRLLLPMRFQQQEWSR